MAINLDALVIGLIVRIILLSPVLWIAGRLLAGSDKAKFTDAIWIVVLGTVIGAIIEALFSGILAFIIVLFIWLALVKHFFDTGWLKALAISIIAIIIWIIIAVIIGIIIGVAIITTGIL
jgi:hypothetical protein